MRKRRRGHYGRGAMEEMAPPGDLFCYAPLPSLPSGLPISKLQLPTAGGTLEFMFSPNPSVQYNLSPYFPIEIYFSSNPLVPVCLPSNPSISTRLSPVRLVLSPPSKILKSVSAVQRRRVEVPTVRGDICPIWRDICPHWRANSTPRPPKFKTGAISNLQRRRRILIGQQHQRAPSPPLPDQSQGTSSHS